MNSRGFRMLFLYELKSKHNASAAAPNTNVAFGKGSVNEHTIRCWYAKFEIGDESLKNEGEADQRLLRTMKFYKQ